MPPVFDYDIPILHPFAVHFPVAFLLAAAVASLVWLVRGRSFWRKCLLFLYALSAAGTAAAYLTGDAAYEQAEGVPMVETFVGAHADAAEVLLWSVVVLLVGFLAVSFWLERRTTLERNPPDPVWVRVVFTVATFVLAALVVWTARLGGTMVWGVPVG